MIKYIDFDGVILDTKTPFFDKYRKDIEAKPSLTDQEFLHTLDWYSLFEESKILGNAINILNDYNPQGIDIITQIFTLKEAEAKIKYLRSRGVKNIIIFVLYNLRKSEVVSPKGNILVDDDISNLHEWNNLSGIPIHYNNRDTNTKYPRITSLESVLDDKSLQLLLSKSE